MDSQNQNSNINNNVHTVHGGKKNEKHRRTH